MTTQHSIALALGILLVAGLATALLDAPRRRRPKPFLVPRSITDCHFSFGGALRLTATTVRCAHCDIDLGPHVRDCRIRVQPSGVVEMLGSDGSVHHLCEQLEKQAATP